MECGRNLSRIRNGGSSVPKNGELVYCLMGDVEDPLEPVDSVIVSRATKFVHCLPDRRLDVVDVGENGDNAPLCGWTSGIKRDGADLEMFSNSWYGLYGSWSVTAGVVSFGCSSSWSRASRRETVSSKTLVLDLPGPSLYSHSSSLGCRRHGPQVGLTPSHFCSSELAYSGAS